MFKWLTKNKEDMLNVISHLTTGNSFEYIVQGCTYSSSIGHYTVIESSEQERYRVYLKNGFVVDFSLLSKGIIDEAFLFSYKMINDNYTQDALNLHLNKSILEFDNCKFYLYCKSVFNTKIKEKYFINGKVYEHTNYETIYFGEMNGELLIVRNALEEVYSNDTNISQASITTQHGVPIQISIPNSF